MEIADLFSTLLEDYIPSSPVTSLSFHEYEAQRGNPVTQTPRASPNIVLDSDDIPLDDLYGLRYSSEVPLIAPSEHSAEADHLHVHPRSPDEEDMESDSSEDVPLVAQTASSLHHPPKSPVTPRAQRRQRSYSLPHPPTPSKPQLSPDILYSPSTARRAQNAEKAAKRRETI